MYYVDLNNLLITDKKMDNSTKLQIKIGFILKELTQIAVRKIDLALNNQEVLSSVNQDNVADIVDLLKGLIEESKKISTVRILIFYSLIDTFLKYSPEVINHGGIISSFNATVYKKYSYNKGYESFK